MPSKNAYSNLLVVAHPDDETIFFSGLLQTQSSWHVVCVTDGNADGLGAEREKQFKEACKVHKVKKAEILKLPDIFERRLDVESLVLKLESLGKFKKVFTHGILGEYGHNHHQDVCYAVHKAFSKTSQVYSVAYNTYPTLKISLTSKQFEKKTKILWNIYHGEVKRLVNYLPATFIEGFVKVDLREVETIYQWLSKMTPLKEKQIKIYRWLIPYLKEGGAHLTSRLF